MARSAPFTLPRRHTEVVESDETRWPVLYSALLVVVSSLLLWAMIIGGIRWLIG